MPINFSGSDELSKIRILSSIDEFAQIHALEDMMQPSGKTFKRAIADYLLHHQAYGYPFYFFSSLPVIPIKLLKLSRPTELQWIMLVLRQQVVVFNILSCLLLVYLWTGFRRLLPSIVLLLFLLSIPAVNKHNLLWHPDALSTLFIVLTLLCLIKDNFQFKKWFIYSAIACGLACSTKFMGPFLFLMVLTYLGIVYLKEKNKILLFVKKGLFFAVISGAVFVISSPLIIFGYYQNIIGYLTMQSKMNNFGWGVELEKGLIPWYSAVIQPFYFNVWIITGLLIVMAASIIYIKKSRNLNLLILAAIIPIFLYVIFIIANKNYFYLFPVMLLVGSATGNIFYLNSSILENKKFGLRAGRVLSGLLLFLFLLIICYNSVTSHNIFEDRKAMITSHPSFEFYRKMQQVGLISIIKERSLKVMHTNFIYLNDSLEERALIPDDLITTELVEKSHPDVIIFEKEEGKNFIDISYQKKYIDTQKAKLTGQFYMLAFHDSLPGYSIRISDNYAVALIKTYEH
jgi:hypothetical protein